MNRPPHRERHKKVQGLLERRAYRPRALLHVTDHDQNNPMQAKTPVHDRSDCSLSFCEVRQTPRPIFPAAKENFQTATADKHRSVQAQSIAETRPQPEETARPVR